MKHLHTAIQIRGESEIANFYQTILGFKRQYDFELENPLTAKIFGKQKDVRVFNVRRDEVVLELFLDPDLESNESYAHVCLELDNPMEVVAESRKAGYEAIELERSKGTVYFIKDGSGNIFELKQM